MADSTSVEMSERRTLRRIVLKLAAQHGLENVTVDEVVELAGVNEQRFLGYFKSPRDALFDPNDERSLQLRKRIATEVRHEPLLKVLESVVMRDIFDIVHGWDSTEHDAAETLRKLSAATYADPQLAAVIALEVRLSERALAEGIAERLGTVSDLDFYPMLLAKAAFAAGQGALTFWIECNGAIPLDRLISLAFDALKGGLSEHSPLRYLMPDINDRRLSGDE